MRRPSVTVRQLSEDLAFIWVLVARQGDLIWAPRLPRCGFFEEMASRGLAPVQAVNSERSIGRPIEICPWGWTDAVRRWASKNGWSHDAPAENVVRELNSRRFSTALESQWNCQLDGQCLIESVDRLAAVLRRLPKECDRWCLKAEFAMSARERILGRGSKPTEQTINWVRKRIAATGCVYLEPWVERIDEVGLQITVPRTGAPILEGITPLLTDSLGSYLGSRIAPEPALDECWSPAVEVGLRLAARVQDMGYFGPIGIDAVRYRDSSREIRLRPLQDVNARFTMGRLSLGLRRLLNPGESASWLHVRPRSTTNSSPHIWYDQLVQKLPDSVRVVPTSPFMLAERPTLHGTLLVAAANSADLEQAENVILGSRYQTG